MGVLRRITSIVAALALVGAGAALVWADGRFPAEPLPLAAPELVEVPPGDSVAVCPGALNHPTAGEGEVVSDPRFDPVATSVESVGRVIVQGGEGGRAKPLGEGAATQLRPPLAVTGAVVGDDPVRVEAFSTDAAPALAGGGVFQHLADGDLRGVAATPCVPPASEAWLVAGSTEPGSSARLLLVNPGFTTVTASLEIWDATQKVAVTGLEGMVVPPESLRAVLLEGFVGNAARLAVHATASGGELAVFMQHSRLEELRQGGTELAVPGLPPALTVWVPGVSVTESAYDSERTSVLRVLNPGDAPAAVSVELWGPDGPTTLPGLEQAVVGPGLVADLSLGGLPAGAYTARVSADRPVAAAALSLRSGAAEDPEEFAWSSSAAAEAGGFVPLPGAGLTARLLVGSGAAGAVLATPVAGDGTRGTAQRLEMAAGATAVATLEDLGAESAAALELAWEGEPGFVALEVTATDGAAGELISVLVPRARSAASAVVPVYPAPS
jgi:hypothetical protein